MADGWRLPHALDKKMGRHRRGDIDGETSQRMRVTKCHPHKGSSLSPCITTRLCNFPTREGDLGTGGAMRDAGDRSPPTAGSWLHNYKIPTMGTEAIIQCHGDEEPKGMK